MLVKGLRDWLYCNKYDITVHSGVKPIMNLMSILGTQMFGEKDFRDSNVTDADSRCVKEGVLIFVPKEIQDIFVF